MSSGRRHAPLEHDVRFVAEDVDAGGGGIVETVDNFGALSEPPTHPELLDYLAIRFMERGWSAKATSG